MSGGLKSKEDNILGEGSRTFKETDNLPWERNSCRNNFHIKGS